MYTKHPSPPPHARDLTFQMFVQVNRVIINILYRTQDTSWDFNGNGKGRVEGHMKDLNPTNMEIKNKRKNGIKSCTVVDWSLLVSRAENNGASASICIGATVVYSSHSKLWLRLTHNQT